MLRLALALLVCATVRALGAQRACEDLCAVRHAATACSKCADGQLARAAAYSARGARLCLRGGGEHGAEEEGPPNLGDQQCPNVEPAVALSTLAGRTSTRNVTSGWANSDSAISEPRCPVAPASTIILLKSDMQLSFEFLV